MKKKILLILLVICMLSFISCDKKDDSVQQMYETSSGYIATFALDYNNVSYKIDVERTKPDAFSIKFVQPLLLKDIGITYKDGKYDAMIYGNQISNFEFDENQSTLLNILFGFSDVLSENTLKNGYVFEEDNNLMYSCNVANTKYQVYLDKKTKMLTKVSVIGEKTININIEKFELKR